MGNSFMINCRELYKTGIFLKSQVGNLKNIVADMKTISTDIKETAWSGKDYETFYKNFNEYLDSIEQLENTILDKSELLKIVATKHGGVDKSLSDKFVRSRNNE